MFELIVRTKKENEAARRQVAEHVLTKRNIFSGKSAVFSSHYDDAGGLLME
jgi:hypothetical protein